MKKILDKTHQGGGPADRKIKLGRLSEQLAERYLHFKNYQIIARNFRWALGEGDLFCVAPVFQLDTRFPKSVRAKSTDLERALVLVEVRSALADDSPFIYESIGLRKCRKLRMTFERFLSSNEFRAVVQSYGSVFATQKFERRLEVLFLRGVHRFGEEVNPQILDQQALSKVEITHFPLDHV